MSPPRPAPRFTSDSNTPTIDSYSPFGLDTYHATRTRGSLPSPALTTTNPSHNPLPANLPTSVGSLAELQSILLQRSAQQARPPLPPRPQPPIHAPQVHTATYNTSRAEPSQVYPDERDDHASISTLDLDEHDTDMPSLEQHVVRPNSPATMLAEAEAHLDLLMERDRHDRLRWQSRTPVEDSTPPRERPMYDRPGWWMRYVDRRLLAWRAHVLQQRWQGDEDDDDDDDEYEEDDEEWEYVQSDQDLWDEISVAL